MHRPVGTVMGGADAETKMRGVLSRFGKSIDGNFAIMTALSVSALLGTVGLGVNYAQLSHAKSNLGQALDAAVTSTARDLTTGRIAEKDARKTVEALLDGNASGKFEATESFNLGQLDLNKTTRTLRVTASTDVDVAFPLFGMAKRHRVISEAAALYSDKLIEVAMMLDVTGSMGQDSKGKPDPKLTKIKGLKTASKAAVDSFLNMNRNAVTPRVRVAIVPYAESVNTGLLSKNVFNEQRGLQKPPSLLGWLALLLQGYQPAPDKCATERKMQVGKQFILDTSDDGPEQATVNRDSDLGGGRCPAAALQPLTADAARLKGVIDNFQPGGSTAGHIGIQWTRYLLSPSWKNALTSVQAGSAPGVYDTRKVSKIAVLMTDGEFNTAFADGGGDQSWRSKDFAKTLCSKMKADGIEIFTIGFMLEEAAATTTMQACASDDNGRFKHFYAADNPTELSDAFQSIAQNIEMVRLTN